MSSGSPWEAIAQAMTRRGPYGVRGAAERMTLKMMLQAYTINAAVALHRDREIGSLDVGKQADLILLDRDVMRLAPAQIAMTGICWTMLGGRIVWAPDRAATNVSGNAVAASPCRDHSARGHLPPTGRQATR